jgi:hypothetical protein
LAGHLGLELVLHHGALLEQVTTSRLLCNRCDEGVIQEAFVGQTRLQRHRRGKDVSSGTGVAKTLSNNDIESMIGSMLIRSRTPAVKLGADPGLR